MTLSFYIKRSYGLPSIYNIFTNHFSRSVTETVNYENVIRHDRKTREVTFGGTFTNYRFTEWSQTFPVRELTFPSPLESSSEIV